MFFTVVLQFGPGKFPVPISICRWMILKVLVFPTFRIRLGIICVFGLPIRLRRDPAFFRQS